MALNGAGGVRAAKWFALRLRVLHTATRPRQGRPSMTPIAPQARYDSQGNGTPRHARYPRNELRERRPMPVHFVYRSPYEGPTGKFVKHFPDDTVLAWFQRQWKALP